MTSEIFDFQHILPSIDGEPRRANKGFDVTGNRLVSFGCAAPWWAGRSMTSDFINRKYKRLYFRMTTSSWIFRRTQTSDFSFWGGIFT